MSSVARAGTEFDRTCEAWTTMKQRPSAEHENCSWGDEEAFVCRGCCNNPQADKNQPSEQKEPLTGEDKIRVFVMGVILFMTFATAFLNLLAE